MKTERHGQAFGARCWDQGLSIEETMKLAAVECGLSQVPENPFEWPKFIHGAEEAWQDKNLAHLDEMESLSKIREKHSTKT